MQATEHHKRKHIDYLVLYYILSIHSLTRNGASYLDQLKFDHYYINHSLHLR